MATLTAVEVREKVLIRELKHRGKIQCLFGTASSANDMTVSVWTAGNAKLSISLFNRL